MIIESCDIEGTMDSSDFTNAIVIVEIQLFVLVIHSVETGTPARYPAVILAVIRDKH